LLSSLGSGGRGYREPNVFDNNHEQRYNRRVMQWGEVLLNRPSAHYPAFGCALWSVFAV
jgi:hypothetical protein